MDSVLLLAVSRGVRLMDDNVDNDSDRSNE